MTGRNHHANATAAINELATGYPGYNGQIPFENGFLSEMLQQHGYSTYMVGKYHLMPSEFESAAGPFDRWPLGRGFERFYGFLGGDTSQWTPDLTYDNHAVEPPRSPEEGYHLAEDLADKAIEFIADPSRSRRQAVLPALLHRSDTPHTTSPRSGQTNTRDKFDDGWDAYRERVFARQKELGIMPPDAELSRHDPDVPEWESLPPDARKLVSRMMEVFAGFLSAHRPPRRPADRLPRGARRAREHPDHARSPTTGPVPRADRSGRQRASVLQRRPRAAGGQPRGDRRTRRSDNTSTTTLGMDVGRQHAVSALEARDLPRRRY